MNSPNIPATASATVAVAAVASKTLDIITRQLALVPDYVDTVELAKVVIAAEITAPGLQSALAAIKTNETAIFKTDIGRKVADVVLKILLDAHQHGAAS